MHLPHALPQHLRTFFAACSHIHLPPALPQHLCSRSSTRVCPGSCDDIFQQEEQPQESQPSQYSNWEFCKEPPADDPTVTCFLTSDVDWLDGKDEIQPPNPSPTPGLS